MLQADIKWQLHNHTGNGQMKKSRGRVAVIYGGAEMEWLQIIWVLVRVADIQLVIDFSKAY